MTSVICDKCKKAVNNAVRDQNYHTLLDKTLCRPCKEDFDYEVRDIMESKKGYHFLEYKTVARDHLQKVCK
jgi:hypothetical protein